MKESTKNKLNIILIPKWLCHKLKWHLWMWKSRNKSRISARCVRCGMDGIEFHKLQIEESQRAIKKEKKHL